jgi:hypothetical protein
VDAVQVVGLAVARVPGQPHLHVVAALDERTQHGVHHPLGASVVPRRIAVQPGDDAHRPARRTSRHEAPAVATYRTKRLRVAEDEPVVRLRQEEHEVLLERGVDAAVLVDVRRLATDLDGDVHAYAVGGLRRGSLDQDGRPPGHRARRRPGRPLGARPDYFR